MTGSSKYSNIDSQGRVKCRIIMELLQPDCDNPQPMTRNELMEKTGISKENLKFHLKDARTGLITKGIVRESHGNLSIWFRNTNAVMKAVDYLSTEPAIKGSIEAFFAECFMSVYGEALQSTRYDRAALSVEQLEVYNKFYLKSMITEPQEPYGSPKKLFRLWKELTGEDLLSDGKQGKMEALK